MEGKIIAVCLSKIKGERKSPILGRGFLKRDFGLVGDAHSGSGIRQVSLLSVEEIFSLQKQGLEVGPGDFAENLTIEGIDLSQLMPGTKLLVGEAVIEITQIGKECHTGCAIFREVGKCIMPKKGVFARVLKSGFVGKGELIRVVGGEIIEKVRRREK